MAVTDEEFASQLAEHIASIPYEDIRRMSSQEASEILEGLAKKKGYEDGVRLVGFLKAPGGLAFFDEKLRLAREARRRADEEFVTEVANLSPRLRKMSAGEVNAFIQDLAKSKRYEDGKRMARFLRSPEGRAFAMERVRLAREARRPPPTELTPEEKRRVVSEFKEIMGREPTPAEMYELYAEELKLKLRRVQV